MIKYSGYHPVINSFFTKNLLRFTMPDMITRKEISLNEIVPSIHIVHKTKLSFPSPKIGQYVGIVGIFDLMDNVQLYMTRSGRVFTAYYNPIGKLWFSTKEINVGDLSVEMHQIGIKVGDDGSYHPIMYDAKNHVQIIEDVCERIEPIKNLSYKDPMYLTKVYQNMVNIGQKIRYF